MARFRLIHASDLHFSSEPDFINPYDKDGISGWFEQLTTGNVRDALIPSSCYIDKAAAFSFEIQQNANSIDAIILTGDLSTTGIRNDLESVNEFLYGRVPEEWASISESFIPLVGVQNIPPVFILPGNHDRYESPLYFPSSREFEKVFGNHWDFKLDFVHQSFYDHKYVKTSFLRKSNSILAICRVDFSLTHENQAQEHLVGYLGQGRVRWRSHSSEPKDSLDELIEQTQWINKLAKDDINVDVIWCIHFPPSFPEICTSMKLINEEAVLRAAKDYGVKLILSGHTHEHKNYTVNQGLTRVVCCGTTTAKANILGHHYLELIIDTANIGNPQVNVKEWNSQTMSYEALI